jgi:hypothetical protein
VDSIHPFNAESLQLHELTGAALTRVVIWVSDVEVDQRKAAMQLLAAVRYRLPMLVSMTGRVYTSRLLSEAYGQSLRIFMCDNPAVRTHAKHHVRGVAVWLPMVHLQIVLL